MKKKEKVFTMHEILRFKMDNEILKLNYCDELRNVISLACNNHSSEQVFFKLVMDVYTKFESDVRKGELDLNCCNLSLLQSFEEGLKNEIID